MGSTCDLYAHGLLIYLKTKTSISPPLVTIPQIGWPGLGSLRCEISGSHPYLMFPAPPYDMSTETASTWARNSDVVVRAIVPQFIPNEATENTLSDALLFTDHVVLPHRTVTVAAVFHSTFDGTCRLGLSAGSKIWKHFKGATFCAVQDMLVFEPHFVRGCLVSQSVQFYILCCTSTLPKLTQPLLCTGGPRRKP